jgi:hypothetical protein
MSTSNEPAGLLTDDAVVLALESLDPWDDLARAGRVPAVDPLLVERLATTRRAPADVRDRRRRAARSARRGPGASWWMAGAALVAAATAVLVVLPTLGEQPRQAAEAGVLLDRAASAVADQTARPGQWWRVTSQMVALGVADGEQTSPQRVYRLAETDVRYLAVSAGRIGYLVAGERRYLAQVSGPPGPLPRTKGGSVELLAAPEADPDDPWAAPSTEWLAQLPRDPSALRALLSSYGAGLTGGDAATALAHAATLLELPAAPADLRRAVLRALASYGDELSLVRDVTLGGRAGVAIGVRQTSPADPGARTVQPEVGTLTELVLDPTTAELIGYRTTTVGDIGFGVPDGTVVLEIALSRDVVDAVPADVLRSMPVALGG